METMKPVDEGRLEQLVCLIVNTEHGGDPMDHSQIYMQIGAKLGDVKKAMKSLDVLAVVIVTVTTDKWQPPMGVHLVVLEDIVKVCQRKQ